MNQAHLPHAHRSLALISLMALFLVSTVGASRAHACGPVTVSLAQFTQESAPSRPFYSAVEEGGSAHFTLRRGGDDCGTFDVAATWSTVDGSAIDTADYTQQTNQETFLPRPPGRHIPVSVQVNVPVTEDGDQEPLESFDVVINSATNAVARDPKQAPIYVIDGDGSSRVVLEGVTYSESESVSGGQARIPIFRAGAITGDTSVQYQIDPGETTAGADFTGPLTGTINFAGVDRVQAITLPIVNDALSEADETMTVSLSGGEVAAGTSTTLTIRDNEEKTPPTSRFHHPRRGWKYPYGDYRLREMHVFTSDVGSGVGRSQIALRQNRVGGGCRWWSGTRFVPGACTAKKWHRMRIYETDFFYFRIGKLPPSIGTKVRNYTAFSRATDKAGNIESQVVAGRNANTFEVKRP